MNLVYGIKDKPKFGQVVLFALQQLLAIMAATIAVPAVVGNGMSASAALFGAGVGSIVYLLFTRSSSPVFLGSSFAFIGSMFSAFGGAASVSIGYAGLILGALIAGLVYVAIALIVKFCGVKWIDKLMPPVIIGPTVAIIGLSLAGNAIGDLMRSNVEGGSVYVSLICGLVTLAVTMLCSTYGKHMIKGSFVSLPEFSFTKADWSGVTSSYLLTIFVAYAPVAFVVFAEHLADHKNLSSIVGVNLLENPGLTNTLLGDGIGSFVGAFFGGCANTTYGESIATVAITRNASTISIWGAAVACIIFSLLTPLVAFLETIPSCVMGGVCVALYGFISASGLKMLQPVDLNKNRNLFVASVIFIVGVGGMVVSFGAVEIRTVACALILGILTNLMLSGEKDEE